MYTLTLWNWKMWSMGLVRGAAPGRRPDAGGGDPLAGASLAPRPPRRRDALPRLRAGVRAASPSWVAADPAALGRRRMRWRVLIGGTMLLLLLLMVVLRVVPGAPGPGARRRSCCRTAGGRPGSARSTATLPLRACAAARSQACPAA